MTTQKNNNELFIHGFPYSVHNLAEHYVRKEVMKCDSNLIDDLLKADISGEIGKNFSYEKISNIYQYAEHYINDLPLEEQDILHKYGIKDVEDIDSVFIEATLTSDSLPESDIEALKNIQEDYNNRNPQEIFEWWAVTDWLANNLIELGQPVLSNDYGNWWGRTCSGQAMILDGIFQAIAEQFV